MQVICRTGEREEFVYYAGEGETLAVMKARLEHEVGIPPEQQRLVFDGRQMLDDDHELVGGYNFRWGDRVDITRRCEPVWSWPRRATIARPTGWAGRFSCFPVVVPPVPGAGGSLGRPELQLLLYYFYIYHDFNDSMRPCCDWFEALATTCVGFARLLEHVRT